MELVDGGRYEVRPLVPHILAMASCDPDAQQLGESFGEGFGEAFRKGFEVPDPTRPILLTRPTGLIGPTRPRSRNHRRHGERVIVRVMRSTCCCLLLAACHVTTHTVITRPIDTKRITHPEGAVARKPTLVLTDAGQLRFVEPLECPTEEEVVEQSSIEETRAPNLATFVVGVIATAAGGIMLVRGLTADENSNLFTFAGAPALGIGLPLAIGPWIGNGTRLLDAEQNEDLVEDKLSTSATRKPKPVRRPGPSVPCGERGVTARTATLTTRGLEIYGTVDASGVFAVSPFALVDAFDPASAAWDINARLDILTGARTVNVVIEGRAFGEHTATFLAHADFDTKIEPMRLVPGIVPGTLRGSLTQTATGPAARIVLAVKNEGPGPAWALRGHIAAQGTPALDGRVMYFGAVAKGATLTRELLIPLSPAAADALRNATIDLALELRDAHGTAPTTPVRFRGPLLVDAPRP